MRLLFLAARFPDPPLKGDQVRAFHQLRLLSARHAITLLSFDEGAPLPGRARVAGWCERVITVPHGRAAMAAGALRGLGSRLPLQTSLYQTPAMWRAVRAVLREGRFDAAHVQLARMAPYLEDAQLPRVLDLVDALSLNMENRARAESGALSGPKRALLRAEGRRMKAYERRACEKFEAVTVVSPIDKAAIEAGHERANLHVNGHGVDLEKFAFHAPDGPQRDAQTLLFSGNMGYFPNVKAACWFVMEVLPLIRAQMPEVRLQIVGTRPAREVQELAADPAVTVTGFVPDMGEYQARATVAVVPMRGGSGVQTKVVEAMASGTPLVVTPHALNGLEARAGQHLLAASEAPAFAAETVRLLRDSGLRRKLAHAARQLVEERYAWERFVGQLEALYTRAA